MTSSTDGPDQGGPAAWAWAVNDELTGVTLNERQAQEIAKRWDRPRQHNRGETRGTVVPPYRTPGAAAAAPPSDYVVVPRAELVALYGDAPVDVPVIRRVLGETK